MSNRHTTVVLGGGGVAGIAWMTGLLLGLMREEVHLRDADTLIGTSAGSVVATQVAGGSTLEDLYANQIEGRISELAVDFSLEAMAEFVRVVSEAPDIDSAMRAAGALAVAQGGPPRADRRAVIEGRLPERDWPTRDLRLVAIDVESGARVAFTSESGAALVDAVEASCAVPGVWPVVPIAGRRYMDGGAFSPANIDLAAGADRVVAIAPLSMAMRPGTSPAEQLDALGVPAVLIEPDDATLVAFGDNPLDPACRTPSARAGLAQAAHEAARVRAVLES